jgi:hypothetical protein
MIKTLNPGRCQARVYKGAWSHKVQCSLKPKKDGWCTVHHPDYIAAKMAKRYEKWDNQGKADRRSWLAKVIGLAVLSSIEQDGSYCIKDYGRANAKNILRHYVDTAAFRSRKP